MKTRLLKEARALLPVGVLAAATAPLIQAYRPTPDAEWGLGTMWLVLFSVLMGAVSFGQEFHHRTLPLLLSQGVDRARIWGEKMTVLGAGLITLFVINRLSLNLSGVNWDSPEGRTAARFWWLLPVCAFGTVPFWTLVGRHGLGGVVMSTVFPAVGFGIVTAISNWVAPDFLETPANDSMVGFLLQLAVVIYSIALCFGSLWRFGGMEVKDGAGEELQLPRSVGEFFANLDERFWRGRNGALAALVKKELRLYKLPYLMAAAFCLICLALVLARTAKEYEWVEVGLVAAIGIFMVSVPTVVGAISTAEERHLGVLDAQLMLPVGMRRQWLVKCATATGVWLLLGVGLVIVIALLTKTAKLSSLTEPTQAELQFMLSLWFGQFFCLALAMYASTLATNTVRALLLGVGLWCAIAPLSALIITQGREWLMLLPIASLWIEAHIGWSKYLSGMQLAGTVAVAGLILLLAYGNYRFADISRRRLVAHGGILFCVLVVWNLPQAVLVYYLVERGR